MRDAIRYSRRSPVPPAPSHAYHFRGDTNSGALLDQAGGTAITPVFKAPASAVGTLGGDRYKFTPGQGLRLNNALTSLSDYTLVMSFSLVDYVTFNSGAYAKLVDFKGLTSDNGLYLSDTYEVYCALAATQLTARDALSPNETHEMIVVRETATKLVRIYVDGVLQANFLDAADDMVFSSNRIDLFQEETGGVDQQGQGAIRYLAVYARALTAAEVVNL